MFEQPIVQHQFRRRPDKSSHQARLKVQSRLQLEECQNLLEIWMILYEPYGMGHTVWAIYNDSN